MKFENPWLHFSETATARARGDKTASQFNLQSITPGLVADLIRAGISAGWQPEETGKPAHFTMVGPRANFRLVAHTPG